MVALSPQQAIGVVGAGTMGTGIAQVAASADKAVQSVAASLATQTAKGRIDRATADAIIARIEVVDSLTALAGTALVVEAIVEDLDAKRSLFRALESIVGVDTILSSNTSSISITAIAAGVPESAGRVAGLHFFNPAPVMKLVEVVSGLATRPSVLECLLATARSWGKTAVACRSTPGFIVNRVARPYYAEALRTLEEGVTDAATIDALLTAGAGFRMGPCALMDLVGHDVNYAVTCSVFDASYNDPRFRPSQVQRELVDAGWLGRKSGRGFYRYDTDSSTPNSDDLAEPPDAEPFPDVVLDGSTYSVSDGVRLAGTDGRSATWWAAQGSPTIVYDRAAVPNATRIAFAASDDVPAETIDRFMGTAHQQSLIAVQVQDHPGLIVARTVSMIINEAFDAVHLGVADPDAVDLAMTYGVSYPVGPITWGRQLGLARTASVIDNIYAMYGDPRYRVSLGLRHAALAEV